MAASRFWVGHTCRYRHTIRGRCSSRLTLGSCIWVACLACFRFCLLRDVCIPSCPSSRKRAIALSLGVKCDERSHSVGLRWHCCRRSRLPGSRANMDKRSLCVAEVGCRPGKRRRTAPSAPSVSGLPVSCARAGQSGVCSHIPI